MKAQLCSFLLVSSFASSAHAATSLFEWASNIDGTVSDSLLADPVPSEVDLSSFNTTTGLGTVLMTLSGMGSHFLGFFVDLEIDEGTNTFFNEVGSTSGIPAPGQSWEIDEPGYMFGDIFTNFGSSSLDDTIGTNLPEDVSMALGWNFNLEAGETAVAAFSISERAPGGFYLQQQDPDSQENVYYSSTLRITGKGSEGVPDGGATLVLLLTSLAGLGVARARFQPSRRPAP